MVADTFTFGYYPNMLSKYFKFKMLFLFLILTSCAGYRIKKRLNPFEQYNIRNVAIPIFVNKSNYFGAGPIFTREIVRLLNSYPELNLTPSLNKKSNAILIGIIDGPRRNSESYQTTANILTEGSLKESIGNRAEYLLPTASSYKIRLKIMLIKDPSRNDLSILNTPLADVIKDTPRVIFQKQFDYVGSFNRESRDTINSDSGGIVNYTKTKRYFHQSLEGLARRAAEDFEQLVLNVF